MTQWLGDFVQSDYSHSHSTEVTRISDIVPFPGIGGWVNQAYSRLSTTHGHITHCKLDSVVYVGVCVVI